MRTTFGVKALFALFAFLVAVPAPTADADPITTAESKAAYLTELAQALDSARTTQARAEAVFAAAQAEMQKAQTEVMRLEANVTSGGEEIDLAGNQKAAEIIIATTCNPDIILPVSNKMRGYNNGWASFERWAAALLPQLQDDPVSNIHAWYGEFDFRHAIALLKDYETFLGTQRREAMQRTCAELQNTLFARARTAAQQLDQANAGWRSLRKQLVALSAEVQAAQNAGDQARVDALIQQGQALAEQMDVLKQKADAQLREGNAIHQEGRALVQARMAETVAKLTAVLREITQLQQPKRGRIDRARTNPKELHLRDGEVFGVQVRGEDLPGGLQPADIGYPDGLHLLAISGGGSSLDLLFEKRGDIADGAHELEIAGEKVPFNYREPTETDPAPSYPLVSQGDEAPPAPPAEIEMTKDGKGTDLTSLSLRHMAQDYRGYWLYAAERRASEENPESVFRIAPDASGRYLLLLGESSPPEPHTDIVAHRRVAWETVGGTLGQYEFGGANCYSGLRSTKEKTEGQCDPWRWWEPSTICFRPSDFLTGAEKIAGKVHDKTTCETKDEPSDIAVDYERLVGVTFAPVKAGKYIHILAVAAPAQYSANVKLAWDYSALASQRIQFRIRAGSPAGSVVHEAQIESTQPGGYDFVTNRSGVYFFEFELTNSEGTVVHRDIARAVIPPIPGLGG